MNGTTAIIHSAVQCDHGVAMLETCAQCETRTQCPDCGGFGNLEGIPYEIDYPVADCVSCAGTGYVTSAWPDDIDDGFYPSPDEIGS